MPFKCSVPTCQSNYRKPYISCFRFPRDPVKRKLWISRIRRDNFTYTENARVCINHFEERMIIREDAWTDKDGKEHKIPRVNPILTEDAVPCFVNSTTPILTLLCQKSARLVRKRKMKIFKNALHEVS